MDPKIKCLKCGSYIHETERCWNWHEKRLCCSDEKWKESCDCDICKSQKICQYCNQWKSNCECNSERCPTCNEHLKNYNEEEGASCRWDHVEYSCQFCGLPIFKPWGTCTNCHYERDYLCKGCNLPAFNGKHQHDSSVCKKCGTLLNFGKCIYKCVNGGNRCVHCYWEGVVNNVCCCCDKDQTGQLTKAAIK